MKGNIQDKLIIWIVILLILISICISIDYADNSTINNINDSMMEINDSNIIVINDTSYLKDNDKANIIEMKSSDKIYTTKTKKKKTTKKTKKYPTITVTGYPTCYTCWRNVRYHKVKTTYINYCPNCKKYGTLRNNPKHVSDGEITCSKCDCDFCCYCGRDKVGSGGRHNWNILKKA